MTDPIRALVVDDEPVARKSVQFALEQEGFRCDLAGDGVDALNHLREHDYALVVTDLRMPKMHGHALSMELLKKTPRPVVVVHSCVDNPQLTKDLMLRGVDDIIYKPTNYVAFAAKVKGLVSRRRLASSAAPAVSLEAESSDLAAGEPRGPELQGGPDLPEPDAEASVAAPVDVPVTLAELEANLADLSRLFPVSQSALEAFEMTRTGCDTRVLGEAIKQDPPLAAEVLSIASSEFYNSTGKPVTEIDKAVVRMGQRRTGELGLAASVLSHMVAQRLPWLDARTLWRQSIASGAAVELLVAGGKHGAIGGNLALIAVLHSLGRVVLATLYPGHYQHLIQQCAQRDEALSDQERQLFPENHARVLARVLAHWNVPADACRTAAHLLEPYAALSQLPEPLRSQVQLVKLAVFLGQTATRAWHPWDLVEVPPASLLERLQIPDVADLFQQTRANTQAIIDARSDGATLDGHPLVIPRPADRPTRIHYVDRRGGGFDFLAQWIRELGMEVVPVASGGAATVPKMFVNGLGRPRGEALAGVRTPSDCELVLITDCAAGGESAAAERVDPEQTLVLPAAQARLRAVLERASVLTASR